MGATVGLGAGSLMAELGVGSPVGVLPWGVLVIAPFWPLGTQPPLTMLALTDTIVWWPIVISQFTQKKVLHLPIATIKSMTKSSHF